MALLSEAYVHLRPFFADEKRIQIIAIELERRCPEIADGIYGPSVEVGIRLEEASLRTWVVVAGCLWTALGPVYNAISNYPQFKSGIKELYGDAKEFGESVVGIVREQSAAAPSQVYRVERRTKTPGKIYRIVKMIDKLNRDAWKLDTNKYEERRLQIRYKLHSLLDELEDRRDQELLKNVMLSVGFSPLPKPNDELDSRFVLRLKEDELVWDDVPRLPGRIAAPGPARPRLGWPTTIVLKDGRQIVLDTGRPEHPRLL